MKGIKNERNQKMKALTIRFVCFGVAMICGHYCLADEKSENAVQVLQIKKLIADTYDRPDLKVETAPITIDGQYALADWIQGTNGGRVLLQMEQGEWQIVACGGAGFKDVHVLMSAGVALENARQLVNRLNQAEQSLSAEHIRQVNLFDMSNGAISLHHDVHIAPLVK